MQQAENNLRFSTHSLVAISFLVALIIPYVSYVGRGDIASYVLFLIWLATILSKRNNVYKILVILSVRKFEVLFLFLFSLVALFTYLFITPTTKAFQFTLIPLTYFCIIVMDGYYFTINPEYKFSIFFVLIMVLGIQAAISLPYIFSADDTISRMYTSGELEGVVLEETLKHGVGSANLYSSLCGVFFLGLGKLQGIANLKVKLLLIISLVFILLSIVSSSYSISFWMLAIGGLILLFKSNWRKIKFIHLIGVCLVVGGLVIFYNSFLADSAVMEPIQRKIQLFKDGTLREDGRIDLAEMSMRTFLKNPFFGVGVPNWGTEKGVGEHLPWIDFPAHYGFIGFLPLLLFFILVFKRNFRFYFRSKNDIYAVSCLIGFTIFVLSNCIDPTIFEGPMVSMLLFFYTSMNNWVKIPVSKQ
jgi:hypothetical protein